MNMTAYAEGTIKGGAETVVPFGRYRHYKGNEYEVIGHAVHVDTLEPMVYRDAYCTGAVWARSVRDWCSQPHGTTLSRFSRIEPAPEGSTATTRHGMREW